MSQNPNFPAPGSDYDSSQVVYPQQSPVGPSVQGSPSVPDQAGASTEFRSRCPCLRSQIFREMILRFRSHMNLPPWTDEEYIRYAEHTLWQ